MKCVFRLIPFVIFLLIAVVLCRGLALDPHLLPAQQLGKPLPDFELPGIEPGTVLSSRDFRHQYRLLNVWASWCEACVDEQAFLMRLSQQGVAMMAIDYKDTLQNANQWLTTWGNPFQKIGRDEDGRLALELGVYGTPETFLISPTGNIVHRHTGVLTESIWEQEFLPRMSQDDIKP